MQFTQDFSFTDYCTYAKVVDVYDGDTLRIVFPFEGAYLQWPVRTLGYDAPEMKQRKNAPNRVEKKKAAVAAREALRAKTMGEGVVVIVQCGPFDKYGRILATVYTMGGLNVNQWMMEQHFGVAYDGGKKPE